MRITFVTEFFPESKLDFTGGVESRTYFTATKLQPFHQITIVSRSKRRVAATVMSIFSRCWFMVTATFQASKSKPDIVEGSNFICYLPAFVAARLTKAKAVAWYADVYGKAWFTLMPWPVALMGYVLEKIGLHLPWDQVIAMSGSTKDKLSQAGIPRKKISVVYGGVDWESIRALNDKATSDKPTICTVARLVAYKRIDDLLKAFHLVIRQLPNAQLLIIGDGPERQALENLRDRLNLQAHVHLTGALSHPQVLKLMKRCHAFSLPSSTEGFGLVSIEAAACGLPYVSADIPATREITLDGQGGYLYPVGDYQALATKLIKLLSHPQIYLTKRKQAKQLARDYDWPAIIKKTESIYQATLDKNATQVI